MTEASASSARRDRRAGRQAGLDYTLCDGRVQLLRVRRQRGRAAKLEVALDPVATGLTYPIAEPVDGLVRPADTEIDRRSTASCSRSSPTPGGPTTASSSTGRRRTRASTRHSVHIGTPPVVGSDGIVYGYWESPDLGVRADHPAGRHAEWTTEVAVPAEVTGLYMLLSVESRKARLFANYVLDLPGDVNETSAR